MCGIAGSLRWNTPDDTSVVRAMTDRLRSRGPDAVGVTARGPVVLGHRRLSVIDVSDAANQPMGDGDGLAWIVFNGEIYNFQELRAELADHGAVFRTRGDTEVLLEAYKVWGDDFVNHLNGMFAFAIWDERRRRLVLGRDRLGEKPLFWCELADGIAFASDMKALLVHPDVRASLCPQGLGHYLRLNYTLGPDTLLQGIQKLAPATLMVAARGEGLRQSLYWDLARFYREKRSFRSERVAADELAFLLDDAVRLRLVSDVPLGAFLSGGVDSAAIVASMRRMLGPDRVHTFSMGFGEDSFDEVPQARETARFLGVDHIDRVVTPRLATDLPAIVAAADEPVADQSLIPCYFLAQLARERVTVCLSGDGADELFGGYETYVADKIHAATRFVPRWLAGGAETAVNRLLPVSFRKLSLDYKLRRFFNGHSLSPARAHQSWRQINDDRDLFTLLHPDRRDAVVAGDPFIRAQEHFAAVDGCAFLDQAMYVDIKTWMVDDILMKVDRATMAHALESRAPFLDHRLVEFAAALPVGLKVRGLSKKWILKQSQIGRVPPAVLRRRKQGFNSPISLWLRGPLQELGRDVTASSALGEWVDGKAVAALWDDHLAMRRDNGLRLFGIIYLGLWMESLGYRR